MGRINANNSNQYDIKKFGAVKGAAKAGAAAGAAAAGKAAGAGEAGKASKNEDVLKLSAVAGQAGEAPQVSLDANEPLPKVAHTAALLGAAQLLPPGIREVSTLALLAKAVADKMYEQFEKA